MCADTTLPISLGGFNLVVSTLVVLTVITRNVCEWINKFDFRRYERYPVVLQQVKVPKRRVIIHVSVPRDRMAAPLKLPYSSWNGPGCASDGIAELSVDESSAKLRWQLFVLAIVTVNIHIRETKRRKRWRSYGPDSDMYRLLSQHFQENVFTRLLQHC